ncbi:hypothetical protein [Leptonema illini]|uniref:Uncharacterized protein n=1 Tax=Leptonema illini DSM 21528 TaxID=929563 RepID=H2CEU0_9LEPT|nr:hypothetical protein [Leptonema illini]EHQ07704.1 hypothetical protein Lepil_3039 [Leptonema illini DSM 21528]
MLRTSLQNTILFLRRPVGTGLLTLIVSVLLFVVQPQPWPVAMRLLLSLLPALIPTALAALAVRYHERMNSAKPRLFLSGIALFSWIALLLDIGQTFLPWVLVFCLALIFSFVAGLRYTAVFSLGMIFFASLYGSLRLHQAEQLLYLNLLVRQEQRKSEVQFSIKKEGGRILLFESGASEPVLTAPRPAAMQQLADAESDGFFGLTPAFVLTTNPEDAKAIPMAAVLFVPDGFPAKLWNVQVSSDLDKLQRQGGIGRAEMRERESRCGSLSCNETLWLYEDRFQAKTVQAGYALVSVPMAGPGAGSRTFMLWFREPFVEGLPHHPFVLEIMKGLTVGGITATEEKAD